MNDCPNCEYHRQRAQRWREEAYRLSGYPLSEREWVGLTEYEIKDLMESYSGINPNLFMLAKHVQVKLKEKNT